MIQPLNQLLIEELLISPLCIDAKYAQALMMAAYASYTSGSKLTNNRYEAAYAINPRSGDKESSDYTAGSVGMVVIDGPIVSASEPWYGIKGTIEAANELLAFESDTNIIGTVLYLESGGGAVYALKPIIDVLSTLKKPVVVYSKHILASAAYRIAASCSHIIMYHPQGIVGSLGTMYSMSDMQPMFEKWGMKFFEYYATESVLKNKTFRDAKAGDGSALIDNILDPMNQLFIADIKSLRGDRISSKDKRIYQGETFLADPEGISLGLIDGTGSLQDAVAKVVELSGSSSHKNPAQQKIENTMFGFNQFSKLASLAKVAAASITADQVKAVNEEIVAAKIEGVTLVLDSELEAVTTQNSEASASADSLKTAQARIAELESANSTLTAEVTAAKADKATAETALATMTTDRDSWKAKAVEYGAQPAAESTTGLKEGSDVIEQSNNAAPSFYSEADAELAKAKADAGFTKKAN